MDATKCEAILIAAETGSLTAAAERLGYTQKGCSAYRKWKNNASSVP